MGLKPWTIYLAQEALGDSNCLGVQGPVACIDNERSHERISDDLQLMNMMHPRYKSEGVEECDVRIVCGLD